MPTISGNLLLFWLMTFVLSVTKSTSFLVTFLTQGKFAVLESDLFVNLAIPLHSPILFVKRIGQMMLYHLCANSCTKTYNQFRLHTSTIRNRCKLTLWNFGTHKFLTFDVISGFCSLGYLIYHFDLFWIFVTSLYIYSEKFYLSFFFSTFISSPCIYFGKIYLSF